MDTKLKNSKGQSILFGSLFSIEIITICILAVAASIFAAMDTMSWAKDLTPNQTDEWYNPYSGNIIDVERYESLQNNIGIGGIVMVVFAIGLFVLLAVMVGRNKTDDTGKVYLNWFDRIWSELQIVGFILSAAWAVSVIKILYEIWMRGDYLGIWENTSENISYYS